jgi:hypothetical protein
MNMIASAKVWLGPHSSITFSTPAGETANSLTCPTTTTWNSAQGSPALKTSRPRSMRRRLQSAAMRWRSSSFMLENSGRVLR